MAEPLITRERDDNGCSFFHKFVERKAQSNIAAKIGAILSQLFRAMVIMFQYFRQSRKETTRKMIEIAKKRVLTLDMI